MLGSGTDMGGAYWCSRGCCIWRRWCRSTAWAKQLQKIKLLRLEIFFFLLFCLFYTVIHTSRASVVLCVCVCVCVCVHQLTLTLEIRIFYLRIGWVGGWVLGNTNVLRTENNTLYLRTAPYSLWNGNAAAKLRETKLNRERYSATATKSKMATPRFKKSFW